MAGGPFYMTYPKIIKINLIGKLKPWISAKDVILKVLEIFTTKGNVGTVFEYAGPGVKTLSVPERSTITNMGAECGVTTSVFPSDEKTKEFLKAQGREKDWVEIKADEDAIYDKTVEINLSELEPLAATPHSPGNIKKVKEIEGIEVDQVCLGSCTNSSYRDLMTVAKIIKGKKVHPNVSFVIAPGSKQVLENITKDKGFEYLLSAGARFAENTCGFCIGNSQSPKTVGISLRTSNRNFEGRSGTKDAQVYLVSPETAVAAVITGNIDESMFIQPPKDGKNIKIYRGPNIGEPPKSTPMPEDIKGIVTIKVGDKITTDHIIPAGARMKYRSNVPKYSEFVFEIIDPKFHEKAKKIRETGKFNIIVAGVSYGQGSSREHAAICPMYLGVKAVIAKSLERIHKANLVNFGIIPLKFKNENDYEIIDQNDELEILNIPALVKKGEKITIKDKTKNKTFDVEYDLSDREKKILLAGGTLNLMREKSK
jgi:aconitate hydratase